MDKLKQGIEKIKANTTKDRPLTPKEIEQLGKIRQDHPDNTSADLDRLAQDFNVDRNYLGEVWTNLFTKTIK